MVATEALSITSTGKFALWAGFIGMFVPTILFCVMTMRAPRGSKYFHVITTMITANVLDGLLGRKGDRLAANSLAGEGGSGGVAKSRL